MGVAARSTVAYHLRELEIAQNPTHRSHMMPPISNRHKTILDVGCGIGQTLFAANLAPEVHGYGIDSDGEAISAGQKAAPGNIHLQIGCGEKLDFPSATFDLVICRIALPYMVINTALREMARVLRKDGDIWLVLHALSTLKRRAKSSFKQGNYKDLAYCGFVGINGCLFHVFGWQLKWKGSAETFQTTFGMKRALRRAGFSCVAIRQEGFFVVQGKISST